MKNIIHRPCVICPLGHFKCNRNSVIRTCSQECSKTYSKISSAFSDFHQNWYTKHDMLPERRSIVIRVGNSIVFKSKWEQKKRADLIKQEKRDRIMEVRKNTAMIKENRVKNSKVKNSKVKNSKVKKPGQK